MNNRPLLPMSLNRLAQETRKLFHLKTANFLTGRKELKPQPRKVADALSRMEKGNATSIFQLRSGHCPLNEYLKRFNHHPNGKCEVCKSPETVPHFILYCKRFKHHRKLFRSQLKEDEVKVNLFSITSLLNTPNVIDSIS